MKELIHICKRNKNGTLTVVDKKKLNVELDEETMKLYAKFQKNTYEILGNMYMSYIVLYHDRSFEDASKNRW